MLKDSLKRAFCSLLLPLPASPSEFSACLTVPDQAQCKGRFPLCVIIGHNILPCTYCWQLSLARSIVTGRKLFTYQRR